MKTFLTLVLIFLSWGIGVVTGFYVGRVYESVAPAPDTCDACLDMDISTDDPL